MLQLRLGTAKSDTTVRVQQYTDRCCVLRAYCVPHHFAALFNLVLTATSWEKYSASWWWRNQGSGRLTVPPKVMTLIIDRTKTLGLTIQLMRILQHSASRVVISTVVSEQEKWRTALPLHSHYLMTIIVGLSDVRKQEKSSRTEIPFPTSTCREWPHMPTPRGADIRVDAFRFKQNLGCIKKEIRVVRVQETLDSFHRYLLGIGRPRILQNKLLSLHQA